MRKLESSNELEENLRSLDRRLERQVDEQYKLDDRVDRLEKLLQKVVVALVSNN